jgi:hypothetical protein
MRNFAGHEAGNEATPSRIQVLPERPGTNPKGFVFAFYLLTFALISRALKSFKSF